MISSRRYDIQTVTRTAIVVSVFSMLVCCVPEPPLHLFDSGDIELKLPLVRIDLDTYWDYETAYGARYNWRDEWYYGWDNEDQRLFGNIGYTEPEVFLLRRYYTGNTPYAPHTSVHSATVKGNSYKARFDWGFWDLLVWNDVITLDGVQSLIFDEQTSFDSVIAYTNQSMTLARYQAPRYTRSFYQPEELFSAYTQAVEINENLEGFEYDAENDVYIKRIKMTLEPITYIYLTQVILHHNNHRIVGVDGSGNLSGFGRTTVINTGITGSDVVTVHYYNRLKNNCEKDSELVDIVGGRLVTFGICGQNANRITKREDVADKNSHYLDVTMQFNNGLDSTFVFDVTDQVRRRWKGGVITVELDMDTVRIPSRTGGSAFDAVVKDFEDGGTHEFEM